MLALPMAFQILISIGLAYYWGDLTMKLSIKSTSSDVGLTIKHAIISTSSL